MIAAHVVYMARLFIGPSRDIYCVFFFFTSVCCQVSNDTHHHNDARVLS